MGEKRLFITDQNSQSASQGTVSCSQFHSQKQEQQSPNKSAPQDQLFQNLGFLSITFFNIHLFIWLCQVLIAPYKIFNLSCGVFPCHTLAQPWCKGHMASLVPRPEIKSVFPALQGGRLTTGPPERSYQYHLDLRNFCFLLKSSASFCTTVLKCKHPHPRSVFQQGTWFKIP